ncbi:hypothetical protein Vadar_014945 [Vaccinium darrowii]|uniref:Uncharacterized protein n=1 Tax=Vaccinium darrowii TaxID=229202 RepID=A0ACB7Z5G7_9ERIC|nr:hypothetical protein Vadar_014945 [Vaccinium darrowii]
MGTLDGIIDTVSAVHVLVPLLLLLKTNGKIILVGAPEKPLELPTIPLIMGKHFRRVSINLVIYYGHILSACFWKRHQYLILDLITGRRIVAGSCIGGMKETQEMIDFAGKHNITPQIEVVPVDYVNMAMERLAKADVKYRFVLDIGNTLKAT